MDRLRQHLFLLRELVKRDFQSRYAGSLLGFLWSFVQPLWLLALFTFVFSTVMKVAPLGERTSSFAAFLFAGLLPWMAIHEGILRGATAITDNASLVKKLAFPSELLVFSVVLTGWLHSTIALGVFAGLLWLQGELVWSSLPWLLVAVPIQLALTTGVGLVVAAIHVFFRDTAPVLGLLLNGWFYLTPIVYPLALVPERFRPWLELNPLTPLVGLYRRALLAGEAPAGWLVVAGLAALAAAAGGWFFRRLRPAFPDEV